jgi:transcriptional regulator with XRE-family HTH domain
MGTMTLKVARSMLGLRQIDLFLKTGIPMAYISLIENGLKIPTSEQAKKLNEVLGQIVFKVDEKK